MKFTILVPNMADVHASEIRSWQYESD